MLHKECSSSVNEMEKARFNVTDSSACRAGSKYSKVTIADGGHNPYQPVFHVRASTYKARSDPERTGGHSYLFAPGTAAGRANKKPGQLPKKLFELARITFERHAELVGFH